MTGATSDIVRRTGLTCERAADALAVLVESISPWLGRAERDRMADFVPLASAPRPRQPRVRGHAEKLYYEMARRMSVPLGPAVELAQLAARAIAMRLSPDERRSVRGQLHPTLAVLFEEPARPSSEVVERSRAARDAGHALSTGRPGSQRPISESRPPRERPGPSKAPGARRPRSPSRARRS